MKRKRTRRQVTLPAEMVNLLSKVWNSFNRSRRLKKFIDKVFINGQWVVLNFTRAEFKNLTVAEKNEILAILAKYNYVGTRFEKYTWQHRNQNIAIGKRACVPALWGGSTIHQKFTYC